jgi:hypothetical protein
MDKVGIFRDLASLIRLVCMVGPNTMSGPPSAATLAGSRRLKRVSE